MSGLYVVCTFRWDARIGCLNSDAYETLATGITKVREILAYNFFYLKKSAFRENLALFSKECYVIRYTICQRSYSIVSCTLPIALE